MTEATYAALLGASIGSLGGVAVATITSIMESRRNRRRLIYEVAVKEWETHAGMAERILAATGRKEPVVPLITYLDYYSKLLKRFEVGRLTQEKLNAINKDRSQFLGTLEQREGKK
jgi:hypothetical protein